jgi:cytochrome oxidase Cu insertion factor (SCO1/SenC/PrrC family)
MDRKQKILVTCLWAAAVLAMLGVVGTGLWARRQAGDADQAQPQQQRLEVLYDAPSFSLTDQEGKTVTRDSLRGQVWVAMVFFTQCPGVCPAMTMRMTELQKAVTSRDVKIVSFTLDPEHDTPEAMKVYAERFNTDQSRWFFLTGPKDTMYETARGLKLAAEPAHDGQPIVHTQKVLLIDREGRVRGVYDTNDDDSMKGLAADAAGLARQPKENRS